MTSAVTFQAKTFSDLVALLLFVSLSHTQGLRWPSNRNELLQILVRKPWNKSSFTAFCGVLRRTQGDKLTHMFVNKADDFVLGLSKMHSSREFL